MNAIKTTFLAALFGAFLMANPATAQGDKQSFVTVTKLHWNMDLNDYNEKDWLAVEKEYLDKVVKKNEFILEQKFLTHYFTEDNSELLLWTKYPSWDAIEKASDRTDALVKSAWPDEKQRNAYFDRKDSYYQLRHSDEIYQPIEGAKMPTGKSDKAMLYYVRKSHFAAPKDGTDKEITDLHRKYLDAVTYKNDYIKGYYPYVHAWGNDKTEFTEVFVYENLGDIEKSFEKNGELFKATWNDDGKRKAYDKDYNKYFTGIHGDYIYRSVPELSK